jgi:hypothetical protein
MLLGPPVTQQAQAQDHSILYLMVLNSQCIYAVSTTSSTVTTVCIHNFTNPHWSLIAGRSQHHTGVINTQPLSLHHSHPNIWSFTATPTSYPPAHDSKMWHKSRSLTAVVPATLCHIQNWWLTSSSSSIAGAGCHCPYYASKNLVRQHATCSAASASQPTPQRLWIANCSSSCMQGTTHSCQGTHKHSHCRSAV